MANTPEYSLTYHGSGADVQGLIDFVRERSIPNVFFTGIYTPDRLPNLYLNTDFVLCYYGADDVNVRTLLPNRLYEACFFYKPLIVSEGTLLADIVRKYSLGVVLHDAALVDLREKLDCFYESQAYSDFVVGCDLFLSHAKVDDENFRARIFDLLKSISDNKTSEPDLG